MPETEAEIHEVIDAHIRRVMLYGCGECTECLHPWPWYADCLRSRPAVGVSR